MTYGNIGSPERPDFTVIGPAANRVARIERVASRLGRPVVLSSTFAALCGRAEEALGVQELNGLSEAEEAFAPFG